MPVSQPTPAANAMSNLPDNIAKGRKQASPGHNYGSLDSRLLAVIRLVDSSGNPIPSEDETVVGVLTDGDLEFASQYSTPFENSNPEQKFPTLLGMIQSGQFVASLGEVAGNVIGEGVTNKLLEMSGVNGLASSIGDKIEGLQGRSNLTKVNSTQIFVSTQPVALSGTIFFRAWKNAAAEVEEQVRRLEEWSLPRFLSAKGIVQSATDKASLESLFPSIIPPFVSVDYGGKRYAPMILESANSPLVVERDQKGNRLAVSVQCRFVSRQAWDANDVRRLHGVPVRA